MRTTHRTLRSLAALALVAGLAGCSLLKPGGPGETAPDTPGAATPTDEAAPPVPTAVLISAQTPLVRTYRKTGAGHIYKLYPKRIYKGKIPPLVYAVVVVETHLDETGRVTNVTFSRTPSHAPEVPGKIDALIRAASPLPAPGKVGAHTYVDTWLWDKSGNFQLDTLTKGQRSR